MSVVALECKRCGGSLPAPGSGSAFVTCPFCGTSHAVSAPAIMVKSDPHGPSDYEVRKAAKIRAWQHARASSTDPVVALRAVVAEASSQLTSEQGVERAARLAEGLANGFDEENKTHAILDETTAIRIAEAAVKAIIELRHEYSETTEVNLPFLIANETGPKHLLVTVTRAKLAELDAMGVYVVKEAAPPPAPPIAAHPQEGKAKKKGWWPFG